MKMHCLSVFAARQMGFMISNVLKTEAPHKDKGLRQFHRDVSYLYKGILPFFLLMFFLASPTVLANTLLPDNVRKVVLNKHLPHVAKYERCLVETVKQTNLPEMLLLSVLLQENGRTGKYSVNRNKTKDYGIGQINDVRKKEISQIGLTLNDVLHDGCKNIIAVAYLLTNEFRKADGDLWTAVGNYHYSKHGPYPRHHYKYIRFIHSRWSEIYETVKQAAKSS